MTECQNCGAHVDPDFARVMGDNDGRVHHCPDCTTFTAIRHDGAAADPEWEPTEAHSDYGTGDMWDPSKMRLNDD